MNPSPRGGTPAAGVPARSDYLARHGAALIRNGFDIVPIRPGTKAPGPDSWQDIRSTLPLLEHWLSHGYSKAGIGILTKNFPAVDIDVLDPEGSAHMVGFTMALVGWGMRRIGLAPKTLLWYRTAAPFKKVISARYFNPHAPEQDPARKGQRIEVLGDGQQAVALATHPDTGKPYKWSVPGENPIDVPCFDLVEISEEQANAICSEFERWAESQGWERMSSAPVAQGVIARTGESADPLAIIAPPVETSDEVARVRSAIEAIKPHVSSLPYEEWFALIAAIKWLNWICGEELARDLSEASDKHSDEHFERTWRGAQKRDRAREYTVGTLFHVAKTHGWDASISNVAVSSERETFGDTSNALRFVAKFRGQFLFCYAAAKWLQWDGLRWAWCTAGEDLRAARVIVAEAMDAAHAALKHDSTDANKSNYAHALAVHRNARRLDALLTVAGSEQGMSIASPAQLDTDPWLLGVRNGVLNLRTGTLLVPDPVMRISKQAGASFDRDATCPRWLRFLHDVFIGDAEMVAFMQRACGYALTGLVDEEVLFLMWGTGANGKSVFANVLHAVFGEYAVVVRATMLARDLKGNGGEAEREKNRLPGARLALINEVASGDVFDDQRVKELASRERISARALYAESFDFAPSHTIFIRGNHQPGATDATNGFWRRVVLVPFTRQFSEGERVADLDRQILEAERGGVLAWMVEGCLAWQRETLRIPASIRAASDQYRKETDLLGEWLATRCKREAAAETLGSLLFHSFCEFLRDGNMKPPTSPVFGRQLAQRGFKRRESNGKSFYSGISLNLFEWEEGGNDADL